MTLLIFLLILSFLVIIHEAGHFLTALWMKVKVEEFAVGYPPRALTLFRWRGIPFTLNILPFGGFVKMQGEDGPEEKGAKVQGSSKNAIGPFYTKSKKARLLILVAGVVMNFVFGVLAFATIYTIIGIPTLTEEPVIELIASGSPAEQAGIQAGDIFLAIKQTNIEEDFQSFPTAEGFITYINAHLGEEVTIQVRRGTEEQTVITYARTAEERSSDEGAVGVTFQTVEYVFYPWWQRPFRGILVGLEQSVGLSILILQAFGDMLRQLVTTARFPEGVAGPVGIVHQAGKLGIFQQGGLMILNFAGMLSINLAILNILPLPAFDGGRAVMVLLETVIGSKQRERIENKLNYVGLALIITLMILITFYDVSNLFKDWVK